MASTPGSSPSLVSPTSVSLVFAYYENPDMLELQWQEIARYPSTIKDSLEVIVVDDGSPTFPAGEVRRPPGLPRHAIFRLDRDVRWNQDAARNIGAHEAQSPWLLLTDIDHVAPAETLAQVLSRDKDPKLVYSFPRVKFDSDEEREPHPNSYLMTKDLYWTIGGHDEDYKGIYGKDFLFRQRVLRFTREVPLVGAPLARVGSMTVADAGSRTISRDNTLRQRVWGYLLPVLKSFKLWRGVQTLTETYHRVI